MWSKYNYYKYNYYYSNSHKSFYLSKTQYNNNFTLPTDAVVDNTGYNFSNGQMTYAPNATSTGSPTAIYNKNPFDKAKVHNASLKLINIARAFLKNAPILLLDEITANLDTHNEILINKAIDNLTQTHNKTIIMVAHKLTSIKYAHKVALVDEGKLIDFGTHTELLQRCEKYQNLWNMYADTQKWSIGARGQL